MANEVTCVINTLFQTHIVLANSKVFLKYDVVWDWLLAYPLFFKFGLTNLKKLHGHFSRHEVT